LAVLILPLLLSAGCRDRRVDQDAPRAIKLAVIIPESHVTTRAMRFFQRRAAEISGGKLQVQVFPSGQLGNADEVIDGCRTGDIELAQNTAAVLAEYVPLANAVSMPYIFRDPDHQARVLDGEIVHRLDQKCRAIGIELLGFLDSGTRNITTKKGPIRSPDDLRGLKIRAMDAQLMVDSINALGASAVAMNQGEVFTALQQGLLDGWENNPPTVVTFRMYETGCIYYAWTRHFAIPDVFIASSKFMNELAEQQREWVRAAAAETLAHQRRTWREETQACIQQMIDHGMKLNDVDAGPFRERMKSVYEKYYRKYGEEFRRVCEQITNTP
jgi:tripartite ATP-independent transporter DctP family solute receptor